MTEVSTNIPFEVSFSIANADSDISIVIQTTNAVSASDIAAIDAAMAAFEKGALLGMFSGETFSPSDTSIVVSKVTEEPTVVHYNMKMHSLDPGAFHIFINLLLRIHRSGTNLHKLTISPISGDGQLTHPANVEYPAVSRFIAFPWVIEDVSHPEKDRVIEIEFKRNLEAKEISIVTQAIEEWDELVRLGGFTSDYAEVSHDDIFTAREIYLVHPSIVEHTIVWIEAADAAYYALVNLAGRLNEKVVPVSGMIVR